MHTLVHSAHTHSCSAILLACLLQIGKHKRKFGLPFREMDSNYVKERRVYRAEVSALRKQYW